MRRLKAGSLFKLVFTAVATTTIPMFLFFGVLAFFGAKTVTVSGEYVTGIKGLGAAILMAPFFAAFFSAFAWVGSYIGLRVWGRFSPLVLEYVPADEPPGRAS